MIKTILLLFIIIFLSLLNVNEYFVDSYIKIMNYDFDKLEFPEYNQSYEFVPKNEYKYIKDSKYIDQYYNKIKLGENDYKNLRERLKKTNETNETNEINEINEINETNKTNETNETNETKSKLPNYLLVKKELSLSEFNDILRTLKLKFKNPNLNLKLKENAINNNLYQYYLVKEWIIEQLSLEADKDKYKIRYVNNKRYKYKQDILLKYLQNDLFEQFIFKMRVYRPIKFSHFIVYFDILFDKQNFKYYINDLLVLGTDIQENIDFGDYKRNLYPEKKLDKYDEYSIEDIKQFIDSKQKKKSFMDSHYCFFKDAKNKLECKSPRKNDYSIGIWDSKCINNEDCPFYKKNNNYPNNRGGCKNGYCEMPVNVTNLAFKQYVPDSKPLCYNCEKNEKCEGIDCNKCCEDQKDKDKYPMLNGPDYIFPNDFNQRIKHSKSFLEKNMSPIKLLT